MFDISAASDNLLPPPPHHHHHHNNPRLLQELISVLRYDFLYSSSSTSSTLSSLSYSPRPLNIFLLHLPFFFNPFSSSTSSSPIPRFSSTRHKSHSHLRYHFLVLLYPATQISPKRRSHLQILGARTVTQSPTLLEWPLNLDRRFLLGERKMKHFCTEGKKQRQLSWTEKELPYDQEPGNCASLFLLLLVLWCPSVHRVSLSPWVSHYRTHASSTHDSLYKSLHNNAIQHTDLEVWTIKSLHSR